MATDKLVDFNHVTDYISREAAYESLNKIKSYLHQPHPEYSTMMFWEVEDFIETLPAADVRPVVRARWKAHGDCGVTECPVCRWSIEECIDYNFCPNCGADMREVSEDG